MWTMTVCWRLRTWPWSALTSMRTFTLAVFVPATAAMAGLALLDVTAGTGRLWRAAAVGAVGGLLAAFAYDVFRLPFVFAKPLGIAAVVPALPGSLSDKSLDLRLAAPGK